MQVNWNTLTRLEASHSTKILSILIKLLHNYKLERRGAPPSLQYEKTNLQIELENNIENYAWTFPQSWLISNIWCASLISLKTVLALQLWAPIPKTEVVHTELIYTFTRNIKNMEASSMHSDYLLCR